MRQLAWAVYNIDSTGMQMQWLRDFISKSHTRGNAFKPTDVHETAIRVRLKQHVAVHAPVCLPAGFHEPIVVAILPAHMMHRVVAH